MLKHLYKPKFLEKGDIIILNSELKTYEINLNKFQDPTELELFVNHIHILDEFENNAELEEEPFFDFESKDFKFAWDEAKRIVTIWAEKLKKLFPTFHFVVIATKYDNPAIRFCKLREGRKPENVNHDDEIIVTI